jgi:hypothetical protein
MALDSALQVVCDDATPKKRKRTTHDQLTDGGRLAFEKVQELANEHMNGVKLDTFNHYLEQLLSEVPEMEEEEADGEEQSEDASSEAEAAEEFETPSDSDRDDEDDDDDDNRDDG